MPDSQKDFHKKLLGRRGEKLAADEIKKLGYRLVKRNFVTPYGEADLIFEKGDETVFVEVKTRLRKQQKEQQQKQQLVQQQKQQPQLNRHRFSNFQTLLRQ